ESERAEGLTRRRLVARAARLGLAASALGGLEALAWVPERSAASVTALPEIQYAITKYLAPPFTAEGVKVRMAPLYTVFATFALSRPPSAADQAALARALTTVEAPYPFTPARRSATVAYGAPSSE